MFLQTVFGLIAANLLACFLLQWQVFNGSIDSAKQLKQHFQIFLNCLIRLYLLSSFSQNNQVLDERWDQHFSFTVIFCVCVCGGGCGTLTGLDLHFFVRPPEALLRVVVVLLQLSVHVLSKDPGAARAICDGDAHPDAVAQRWSLI